MNSKSRLSIFPVCLSSDAHSQDNLNFLREIEYIELKHFVRLGLNKTELAYLFNTNERTIQRRIREHGLRLISQVNLHRKFTSNITKAENQIRNLQENYELVKSGHYNELVYFDPDDDFNHITFTGVINEVKGKYVLSPILKMEREDKRAKSKAVYSKFKKFNQIEGNILFLTDKAFSESVKSNNRYSFVEEVSEYLECNFMFLVLEGGTSTPHKESGVKMARRHFSPYGFFGDIHRTTIEDNFNAYKNEPYRVKDFTTVLKSIRRNIALEISKIKKNEFKLKKCFRE